jgi:hypothetical protein
MKRKETPKWAVTRQHYWGVNEPESYVVEIAYGGLDYANPDALGATYPGEMDEFYDPREAVRAAYRIAIAWKRDHPELSDWIRIATGWTWGYTMPFEKGSIGAAWEYAKRYMDEVTICDACGNVVGHDRYCIPEWADEYTFCSAYCAEEFYAASHQDDEELEEAEDC